MLVRRAGDLDHLGVAVPEDRADLVGVYVRPTYRGEGVFDTLLSHAASWTFGVGIETLTLDVHRDNARAQAAYARCGFVETGRTFTSVIGPETDWALDPTRPGASNR